jgi:tRNA(Leu) C34 or U34 (ribose-2'-O)-methylase TrmL
MVYYKKCEKEGVVMGVIEAKKVNGFLLNYDAVQRMRVLAIYYPGKDKATAIDFYSNSNFVFGVEVDSVNVDELFQHVCGVVELNYSEFFEGEPSAANLSLAVDVKGFLITQEAQNGTTITAAVIYYPGQGDKKATAIDFYFKYGFAFGVEETDVDEAALLYYAAEMIDSNCELFVVEECSI